MNDTYWLRKFGLLLFAFGIGLIVGKGANPYLITIFITTAVGWFVLYDFASYDDKQKGR